MGWMETTQRENEMIMHPENWGDWANSIIHPYLTLSANHDDNRTFWGSYEAMQEMVSCWYGQELGMTIRYKSDESF